MAGFGHGGGMTMMGALEVSWPEVMRSIASGTLTAADVKLRREASVVLYLVSPDYALRAGGPCEFSLDREAIEDEGGHAYFSSSIGLGGDAYRTDATPRSDAPAT